MKKQKTTYNLKSSEKSWKVIDATDMVLGRLATNIASILSGKTKIDYNPAVDNGDFVIVCNIEKIRLTGNKVNQKVYYSHSGYPGGLKETPFLRLLNEQPHKIIEKAVQGMLPKNRLGRKMITRLKLYKGSSHPHEAQVSGKKNSENKSVKAEETK